MNGGGEVGHKGGHESGGYKLDKNKSKELQLQMQHQYSKLIDQGNQ